MATARRNELLSVHEGMLDRERAARDAKRAILHAGHARIGQWLLSGGQFVAEETALILRRRQTRAGNGL